MKSYKGDYLNHISLPLGGIGAGSISIAGNGMLVDPEINNRPNREACCGYSGFAVKAEKNGKLVDCRLLCGDRTTDLSGTIRETYGSGDSFFSGFRHFSDVVFHAEFPFAVIKLSDTAFPATAVIEAFNPFIPSNDRDSSIPAAFFNITLTNTAEETMTYHILQNMTNLLETSGFNRYWETDTLKGITLNSAETQHASVKYGNITIATDSEHTSHTDYWFRGTWFDQTTMFKNALLTPGSLKNRVYDDPVGTGKSDTATLAANIELEPGESKTMRFLISWYVPNANCYWQNDENVSYKNYYSTIFKNSEDVATYCFANWVRLYSETKLFTRKLYASTLPAEVLDAIGGNIAILKSSTCLRLADGSFWAWEGVWRKAGSCEGTCQHVYNYAYAMAFLFPKLEQGVRNNEMNYCLEESGKMNFRMSVSLKKGNSWRACVDGQMGFIIKCYREWKLSGDSKWLMEHWSNIKKCLTYTWSKENPDCWDPQKRGIITGRQHNTLDVELFGVHAWLTGMYHAALSAAAEMADFLGESQFAKECRSIFQKGQALLDEKSFNGEYYVQLLNVDDKEQITVLTQDACANLSGNDNGEMAYYWDDELKQLKYQIENGCEIDQVLADWHADINGLPNVFERMHRKSALKAIFKYNFCAMHDVLNPCRVFACNDEKGVLICQWPEGVRKPAIPIPYAEECMSGFEYAVAANMLQCGMEDEALEIVREIRRRYDGKRRNPFAELECGASYGRAMASYSFLLIYSGFKFDLPNKTLGFHPMKNGNYFWSADGAWGTVNCEACGWRFTVDYGSLELEHFVTTLGDVKTVCLNGIAIPFYAADGTVTADMRFKSGDVLSVSRRA